MKTVVRDNDADPPPWMLTLRLALHDITRYHANELYELDSDPRVMRYIGSGQSSTHAQIDEVEVGYRLRYGAWGRGFATEGARELVRYGFDDLGLQRIVGVTHPDNEASQRVLQKIGLTDIGWGRYYGRAVRVFETVRDPDWRPVWPERGKAAMTRRRRSLRRA